VANVGSVASAVTANQKDARERGRRSALAADWMHLARRFVGSLWPLGPAAAGESWAQAHLLPGEVGLWGRMSNADRRHALGVAQRTQVELGEAATRPVLAAALLHDVGKIDAGLGPVRRALATVAGMVAGRDAVQAWTDRRRGVRRRFGRYLTHDVIGADLLTAAGSDPLTITWAREHHLSPERWTVPADIGAALKAADDD
jgi:hypothetical protein